MKSDESQLIWEAYGRDSYDKIMRDQEQFDDIAYRFYGDMEENELRLHHSILGDLLEMDELDRREAQGQGPQRD